MSARRALFVAPFDELAEPRRVADLAARAEERGWEGFFVWDHIRYSAPTRGVADPWVVLSAIACATERLVIGPMVTPVSRRRPHKLARETVTLDRLSGGRLILGAGLGSDNHGEFEDFGEVSEPLERAARWDGLFPIEMPGPDALRELIAETEELRGDGAGGHFDYVIENPPGT